MKLYPTYCLHNTVSDYMPTPYKTLDQAIERVNSHFLSYGFELRDGKPFDPSKDDGGEGGFACFKNWEVSNGLVSLK